MSPIDLARYSERVERCVCGHTPFEHGVKSNVVLVNTVGEIAGGKRRCPARAMHPRNGDGNGQCICAKYVSVWTD